MLRSELAKVGRKRRAVLEAAGQRAYSTFQAPSRDERERAVTTPRRRYTGPSARVCRLVDARSGRRCEYPDCWRAQADRHHRLNRKSGGRHGAMKARVNGAAWLLGVCRPHHRMVTNPVGGVLERLKQIGWVLVEGQDARLVPVSTWYGVVLLNDEGGFTELSRECAS